MKSTGTETITPFYLLSLFFSQILIILFLVNALKEVSLLHLKGKHFSLQKAKLLTSSSALPKWPMEQHLLNLSTESVVALKFFMKKKPIGNISLPPLTITALQLGYYYYNCNLLFFLTLSVGNSEKITMVFPIFPSHDPNEKDKSKKMDISGKVTFTLRTEIIAEEVK